MKEIIENIRDHRWGWIGIAWMLFATGIQTVFAATGYITWVNVFIVLVGWVFLIWFIRFSMGRGWWTLYWGYRVELPEAVDASEIDNWLTERGIRFHRPRRTCTYYLLQHQYATLLRTKWS